MNLPAASYDKARTANISPRTRVVIKQMQSNPIHDKAHWGHRGTLASCGVLDRMAGGWHGVLGMLDRLQVRQAVPHGKRFWAFTPFGGGDMEIKKSLSNLQCYDV